MFFLRRHRYSSSSYFYLSIFTTPTTASVLSACFWTALDAKFETAPRYEYNHKSVHSLHCGNLTICSVNIFAITCGRLLYSTLLSLKTVTQTLRCTAALNIHVSNVGTTCALQRNFGNCCSQPVTASPPFQLAVNLIISTTYEADSIVETRLLYICLFTPYCTISNGNSSTLPIKSSYSGYDS